MTQRFVDAGRAAVAEYNKLRMSLEQVAHRDGFLSGSDLMPRQKRATGCRELAQLTRSGICHLKITANLYPIFRMSSLITQGASYIYPEIQNDKNHEYNQKYTHICSEIPIQAV